VWDLSIYARWLLDIFELYYYYIIIFFQMESSLCRVVGCVYKLFLGVSAQLNVWTKIDAC